MTLNPRLGKTTQSSHLREKNTRPVQRTFLRVDFIGHKLD
jgi:hypothetical protein